MKDYDVLMIKEGIYSDSPYRYPVDVGMDFICKLIEKSMPLYTTTNYETRFLRLYFGYLKSLLTLDFNKVDNPVLLFNALLPIPQMQLYVHDPLKDEWSGAIEPSNNFRVDFGFWTGTRLIAIEIDGNEPSGYARDIRRDRLLRDAEVDVIHILNTEIEKHAERVIYMLLPDEITYDWRRRPALNEPRPITTAPSD